MSEQIKKGYIPYEYYKLNSMTFSNSQFRPGISNISFCLIDAEYSRLYGVNTYSKMMFRALPEKNQLELKNKFSIELDEAMKKTMESLPKNEPKFSYNIEKSSLESIVEIYENDLPISLLGKGNESILKIKNLIKHHDKAMIIGIEKPENHLSYSTMNYMIEIIHDKY